MENYKEVKKLIYQHLQELIIQKINIAESAIQSAKESRDNDTKSSAGDKYETGREMMQREINKYEEQLYKAIQLKKELDYLNLEKEQKKVEKGSLVITDKGIYFLSVGLGKIQIDKEKYFAISLASPIGNLLHQKEVGTSISFNGRSIVIEKIV